MCFNDTVSLGTYITGLLGSAALAYSKKYPEAMFFTWIIQMQGVEYLLWKNQPCSIENGNKICNIDSLKECNNINKNTTIVGIIINHTEPLILFLGIKLFSRKRIPKNIEYIFYISMIIILIYTIYVFNITDNNNLCTTVSEESNPHLYWKWNGAQYNDLVYLIFLSNLMLLAYYGLENGKFNSGIIGISFIISYIIYGNTKSTGAMWCFFAAFAPWIILLHDKIINS